MPGCAPARRVLTYLSKRCQDGTKQQSHFSGWCAPVLGVVPTFPYASLGTYDCPKFSKKYGFERRATPVGFSCPKLGKPGQSRGRASARQRRRADGETDHGTPAADKTVTATGQMRRHADGVLHQSLGWCPGFLAAPCSDDRCFASHCRDALLISFWSSLPPLGLEVFWQFLDW